jgi:hypothetical protein
LNPGDKVTDCQRVAIEVDTMDQINKDLATGDINKQIVNDQKKIIDLKDLQIKDANDAVTLWKTESDRERLAYDKERAHGNLELWVGIFSGIGLTVLAGWAIGQVHSK